ncbi:flagellar basal body rod protein FlgB [Desulfovibrio psychrotolerans]|uniref:Flagellar basal body rod protein FlgB n=1 Tax=Desulfovibrio psychrotolerans TaxID=415242 RepID=A0A7J0BWP8_9BACT|nr:flagellar basal body rod protein FlgB [Desulfovibrio psychrotolerans]GFM38140.1 flagellar basal body rod protein FlgB [Desulfovibrio psychrotolerans]
MKSLFSAHIRVTEKVLDMQLQRQNVVMSNMANLKTPGYRARNLEFEEDLQKALNLDSRGKMTRTASSHMPAVFDPEKFGPEWEKVFKPRVVHGEDQVDLDKEMAKMAKNNMQYNALATVMRGNFEGLTKIITEGQK